MKHIILLLFTLISFQFSAAQRISIVDSMSKKSLPFATIVSGDEGFYSAKAGDFELNRVANDTFTVSFLGYKDKLVSTHNIGDTIFLVPVTHRLEQVVINYDKTEEIAISPGRKMFFLANSKSWPLESGEGIIALLKPHKKSVGAQLKGFTLYFSKIIERNELKEKGISFYVRLHIWRLGKNNQREKLLFVSSPIDINSFVKDTFTLDVSKAHLLFNPEGVSIELVVLNYDKYPDASLAKYTPLVRPSLTKQGSNDYFTLKTYMIDYLSDSVRREPLNKTMSLLAGESIERNLRIGVTIIK